jgi:REP element-mobilizing transposase RayT
MFHIRIRCERDRATGLPETPLLVNSVRAESLLASVAEYHRRGRWHCAVFMLMPDHLHALVAFPSGASISRVVGDWKRYHAKVAGIRWQDGYFDHRIRDDRELELKANYIRQNPVAKGLCPTTEQWRWCWEPADCAG